MKLWLLLVTPWRLSPRSRGWLVTAVFGLCNTCSIVVGRSLDNKAWLLAIMLYCAGIALFWTVQVPQLLLVSIDARRLRLPRVRQTIAASVITYVVLCVAVPVLALTPLGANAMAVALAAALTITVCTAFTLLPRYAVIAVGLLLVLAGSGLKLVAGLLPQHPSHATLAAWGLVVLVVLAWVDISRWRALSQDHPEDRSGWRTATIMQFGRNGSFNLGGDFAMREGQIIRHIPVWFQAEADLHAVDRYHPARAIRVALGRAVMPLTWRSRRRQWLYAGGILAFEALVLFGMNSGPGGLVHSSWFWLAIGGFVTVLLSNTRMASVQQRWRGADANLAVLKLLPGLGSGTAQKKHVLRAILLQPFGGLFGLLLLSWLAIVATGAPVTTGCYALLVVLAAAGALLAGVLGTLGGRPIRGPLLLTLFATLLALVALTPGIESLARLSSFGSASATTRLRELFLACWLAWLLIVGTLNLSGWRALQRRPHPFLANAP